MSSAAGRGLAGGLHCRRQNSMQGYVCRLLYLPTAGSVTASSRLRGCCCTTCRRATRTARPGRACHARPSRAPCTLPSSDGREVRHPSSLQCSASAAGSRMQVSLPMAARLYQEVLPLLSPDMGSIPLRGSPWRCPRGLPWHYSMVCRAAWHEGSAYHTDGRVTGVSRI